jgi:hypothetical protein
MPKNTNRPIDGRGPWLFDVPELSPGESWFLDLRNKRYNNQPRYFRRFLPLDAGEVVNLDDTATVEVEYNGLYRRVIPPNVAKSFDEAGITGVSITNTSGSATIAAGGVRVELEKTPYDDADEARANARKSPGRRLVEGVTGVDPADVLRGVRNGRQ